MGITRPTCHHYEGGAGKAFSFAGVATAIAERRGDLGVIAERIADFAAAEAAGKLISSASCARVNYYSTNKHSQEPRHEFDG